MQIDRGMAIAPTKGLLVDGGLHIATSGSNLAENLVGPPRIVPEVLDRLRSKHGHS